ncbi:type II toxin-antitoxin system RelE/ParE family toxin [Rhodohalobacter sp. 8-1]|uniref:type II toxin-antitoxin system RelE/ParE family toxin n=1 Tax=Rhodohalobacter sp. 8-1 TaxID=3131972 RepID=UPI0030EF20A8
MAEVRWTPQSLSDMNNIAEYIAKDSEVYAAIQTERFFFTAEALENQIRTGRIVPEIENESIRELILGFYRIIYRVVDENRVDILTIHHSRRSIEGNDALQSFL